MVIISIITAYIALINLIAFATMGIDKSRAINRLWRISESALFILALAGGSIGAIIGMRLFHHKTRHWYFVYGMPFILFLQLILIFFLYNAPFEIAFL